MRIAALATLVVVALAGAGYLLGQSKTATAAEARRETAASRTATLATAEREAFERSRPDGHGKGLALGKAAGAKAGKQQGERKAEVRVTATQEGQTAAAAPEPAAERTPTAEELSLGTQGPEPVGTTCAPPFSYHMGICKIARPARPDECPEGWTPAGQTGACAPPPGVNPEDPVEWPR